MITRASKLTAFAAALLLSFMTDRALASGATISEVKTGLDIVWLMVAAGLVLLMQIGFMLLEAGFVRSKNSVNVAQKNLLDFTFSAIVFALIGFMIAFGASSSLPFGFDTSFFALNGADNWVLAFFVFQVMFCGTATTIVSGAVAERMRLTAYVMASIFVAAFVYPMFVHWAWGNALGENGGAFLAHMGFVDFAGSTVVHATGAWFALAACIVLGPRIGRFDAFGHPVRFAGHSLVLATSGALLLFVGWIGFNGGSTITVSDDIAHIVVNTILAAATGTVAGYLLGWRQDAVILPEKAICGLLGGLVAVTAGCLVLTAGGALVVGLLGGVAAVGANRAIEKYLKIDDAIGVAGVHGVAGVLGTLAVAWLAPLSALPADTRLEQFGVQAFGSALNFVWAFGLGYLFFKSLDTIMPIRVEARDEELGLNEAEHATRLGIGHVEQAMSALVEGTADLNMRLAVEGGDDAEHLTRLFNALLDNIQKEETQREFDTEMRRSAEEAERLSALANSTFEAICISAEGRIVDGNEALGKLLGTSVKALCGRTIEEFVDLDDWPRVQAAMSEDNADPYEIGVIATDGRRIPVEVRGRAVMFRGMRTRVSAIVDLTERKAAEERIRHVALHDPLTGLANRALFNERVNALIEESKTGGFSCAIVLVDLDRFKDVNDLHGHAAGDTVIKTAADRLRDLVSHTDFVARLGGDEFAVLQANVQFRSQTADLSRRIVEALGEPITIDNGLVVSCGASVGAALCPDDGSDDTTLMVRADTALYNAKNNGRNLFALFEEGMDAELRRRKRLENDLSSAIERNEFELYFQPRVSVKQRKVGGYEALVRWQHPEKGLISPGDFVPVAEQSGKIVQIGEWVLREACRIAVEKFDDERVSVNVSPIQFRDGEFINIVRETLETAGLPPDRLEVEITENVLIDDDQRAISMLRELKELGVRVTLDDFGTGYSSLGYLSRFPFDTIKIDRSFVTGLRTDQSTRSIVETIIKLARALDMDVVGEGVEEIEDLKFLAARGCDELQGYLIGRPAPADQVVRHVADHLLRDIIEGQAESAADMMRSTANAMNSLLSKQSGTSMPVRRKKRA